MENLNDGVKNKKENEENYDNHNDDENGLCVHHWNGSTRNKNKIKTEQNRKSPHSQPLHDDFLHCCTPSPHHLLYSSFFFSPQTLFFFHTSFYVA